MLRRRKKTVAKVKRCPKCGYGVAVLVILNKVGLRFECDFCGHATSAVETVAEAVKLWNGGVVYDA